MREALEPVLERPLVDDLVAPPARAPLASSRARAGRRGGGSGTPTPPRRPSAASSGRTSSGPIVEELAHERADRQLARGSELGRLRSRTRHEHVAVELARVGALAHLHPALARAAHELARDRRRVGDAVLRQRRRRARRRCAARRCAAASTSLDRDTERRAAAPRRSSQRCEPRFGRREEEVADLVEERRPELLEEADRLLREPHLGRGRELLPHAAHRLRRRAGRDLARVAEHDVARTAAARGGTRSTRRSRPRRLRRSRATGRAPSARRRSGRGAARARPRGSGRRGARRSA